MENELQPRAIFVLEKRYIFRDNTPATGWMAEHGVYFNYVTETDKDLVARNPHKDGLGREVGGGRAAFLYEYRIAEYTFSNAVEIETLETL